MSAVPASHRNRDPPIAGGAALPADHWARAALEAPFHYFRDLGGALPPVRALWGANRAPTLSLPFKTRADVVAVSVPPGSMEGKCRVRTSGVSYAGVRRGVGGLEMDEGVGSLLNRWLVVEEGDVVLRDYRFYSRFVPDPAREISHSGCMHAYLNPFLSFDLLMGACVCVRAKCAHVRICLRASIRACVSIKARLADVYYRRGATMF